MQNSKSEGRLKFQIMHFAICIMHFKLKGWIHGEFLSEPGFWKNESGDYMPGLKILAQFLNWAGIFSLAWKAEKPHVIETKFKYGLKHELGQAQRWDIPRNKMAAMEKLFWNLGWNLPCNRNKVSALGAGWNFSLGWNLPCNHQGVNHSINLVVDLVLNDRFVFHHFHTILSHFYMDCDTSTVVFCFNPYCYTVLLSVLISYFIVI